MVLAAGVYVALDHQNIAVPVTVALPDTTQRSTKSESLYSPPPIPKATPAVAASKAAAPRMLGPGVFSCEDSNGAVTYSEFPCGDGKLVDTRPTSGGFAEQWSITVKHR